MTVVYINRYLKSKPASKFRAEPVPSTGRLHSPVRMWCPRTTQELRAISDPDYGKSIRAARRHLPSAYWDDIFVRSQRSWKAQKKKRQWM